MLNLSLLCAHMCANKSHLTDALRDTIGSCVSHILAFRHAQLTAVTF